MQFKNLSPSQNFAFLSSSSLWMGQAKDIWSVALQNSRCILAPRLIVWPLLVLVWWLAFPRRAGSHHAIDALFRCNNFIEFGQDTSHYPVVLLLRRLHVMIQHFSFARPAKIFRGLFEWGAIRLRKSLFLRAVSLSAGCIREDAVARIVNVFQPLPFRTAFADSQQREAPHVELLTDN